MLTWLLASWTAVALLARYVSLLRLPMLSAKAPLATPMRAVPVLAAAGVKVAVYWV